MFVLPITEGELQKGLSFNKENLLRFEWTFFDLKNDVYRNQRYGQALVNTFGDQNGFEGLFYEPDVSYARDIAWMIVSGIYEEKK